MARGLAKGRIEGKAEGLAEGSKLRNIEIVTKGKKDGISTEILSALTGLSKEEIEKISSE